MKKDIATKWISALRSGQYKQGTGYLNSNVGMCCLGVLCDLYDPNKWGKSAPAITMHASTKDGLKDCKDYSTEAAYPPLKVREWAGLKSRTGELPGTIAIVDKDDVEVLHHITTLAQANDFGQPFSVIADLIEKNWELL
jgi:hypothetical protein